MQYTEDGQLPSYPLLLSPPCPNSDSYSSSREPSPSLQNAHLCLQHPWGTSRHLVLGGTHAGDNALFKPSVSPSGPQGCRVLPVGLSCCLPPENSSLVLPPIQQSRSLLPYASSSCLHWQEPGPSEPSQAITGAPCPWSFWSRLLFWKKALPHVKKPRQLQ